MDKSTTDSLDSVLQSTRPEDLEDYLSRNADKMYQGNSFSDYMHGRFREKGLTQQEVFLAADMPEKYGYRLISGERHTRQRDHIIRLCLGARFTLKETQTALKLYGMSPLYSRLPRDAAMIVMFNSGRYSVFELDDLLEKNGLEPLAPCGEN